MAPKKAPRIRRFGQRLACLAAVLAWACAPSAAGERRADGPMFETDVRPLLKAHCFECHGDGEEPKGGLDVRLVRLLRKGGESGTAVVPGEPSKSLLFERVVAGEMPPGKTKLAPAEVDALRKWIAAGARTAREEPQELPRGFLITAEEEDFWSFRPVVARVPPEVRDPSAVRTPVDAFLLAKLEEQGLAFSPEADRRTLVRRVWFDLIGLPPPPQVVEEFVDDPSPFAYEALIERLLASPQYGERWGRHWLDVAGYADSEGVTGTDPERKTAWKYRDYVVRAFNADLPWDRFLREQLAGDESTPIEYADKSQRVRDSDPEALERLAATGFLRMAPDGTATADADVAVEANQHVADTLQIVATAFLGLTVQCAQCHNHRYDPIPQTDYFRLRAVFEPGMDWKAWRSVRAREVVVAPRERTAEEKQAEAAALAAEQERNKQRLADYKAALDRYLQEALEKVPESDRAAVKSAFLAPGAKNGDQAKLLAKYPAVADVSARARKDFPPPPPPAPRPEPESIRAFTEVPGQVPTTYLFERGEHLAPRQPLTPGGLSVLARHDLGAIPERQEGRPTTGRRSALADWLTHERQPLTTRVLVNRFWMHHFGKGLVDTPADFGALGGRPSHPELLDWLAHDFRTGGWSLKRLHRTMMTSTAYRQASVRSEALDRVDPDNRLLGRMPVRRLEAEIVRDAILAVSGRLNPKPFGPPLPVMPDEQGQIVVGVDTRDGAGRPTGKVVPLHGEEFRRSLYVSVRRSRPLGMLETFDGAAPAPTCECRTTSTVAPQSLLLMNNPAVVEQAGWFADRVQREAGPERARQIDLAWRIALSRPPTDDESSFAAHVLDEQTRDFAGRRNVPGGDPARAALASLCQALVGSNPFLYVD